MADDRREYGRLNDLAYTSTRGCERGIPTNRSKAQKLQARAERRKKQPKTQKET